MRRTLATAPLLAVAMTALAAMATAGWDPEAEKKEMAENQQAIADFKAAEPGLDVYFKEAYAYAVFPSIGKGGLVIGGSRGTGLVYEDGKVIGHTTVTAGSIGLQAGYQTYSELIFFKDKATFENFKNGDVKMSAEASAVALKKGAGSKADFNEGVAVFVRSKGGLMADASVGGQKFTFEPKEK